MRQTLTTRQILAGEAAEGTPVTLKGWLRTKRDSKAGLSFLHVLDGSSFHPVQVVAKNDLPNYEDEVLPLSTGCSVIVDGVVVPSRGKGQDWEIQAERVQVVGQVEDPLTYPMSAKRHTMEHLRKHAHLRPRTNIIGAVSRVRNALSQAIHRYFDDNGFLWVHTPIVTTSDAEGAGDMFRVTTLDLEDPPRTDDGRIDDTADFFGRSAFLTVSGQLNVEAYCLALSKVYTFGPTFRAENSNTSRHLAEFWMVEPEIAFADLDDDAALAEDFCKAIFQAVLDRCPDDMAFFDKHVQKGAIERLERFIAKPFARMTYTEAIAILEKSRRNFEFPVSWGADLQAEHERFLTEEHVKAPLIVTDYPKDIKAFYMRLNDDGRTVAAMDVLAPGIGEIIGGSQREDRLDVLDARMREVGVDPSHYDWYRDLRRYGSVPHAGFGLGLERALGYVTGVGNVRDLIPYPRTPKSAPF